MRAILARIVPDDIKGLDVLVGSCVISVLTLLILGAPAKAVVGGCVAILFGLYFFTQPKHALLAVFFIRVVIDLFWWVPASLGGLNVLEAFGGGIAALAAVLFYLELRRVERIPGFLAMACYLAVLVIAAGRSGDVRDAAEIMAKYIVPLLLMFLISAMMTTRDWRHRLLLVMTLGGVVSLMVSTYHLGSGQIYEHYRQGYYRLVGGYHNLHNHALFLLTLNTMLLFWLTNTTGWKRVMVLGLQGLALACMYYTFVRTALTGFAVFVGVYLAIQRRWGLLGLGLGAGLILVLTNASMQDRFSDLVTFLGDDALADRRTLGSGRIGIWTSSMAEFSRQSPGDILLGLGIGGHYEMTDMYADMYRSTEKSENLDSHNDYLSLLYQLGPIAVLSYIALQIEVVRQGLFVFRNAADSWTRKFGAYMIALTSVTVVTNFLSNSYIQRVTVAWLFWGMVGILFASSLEIRRRQALEQRPGVVPLPPAAKNAA
ncbi:MAG: hypothetical protein GY913_35430 [Proteobacteria bacterium]|nr:hypothetical protein [Pseudomonadota bacterium]MCP4922224.1 hypothetical protein [Pseudomonadota bacterium]